MNEWGVDMQIENRGGLKPAQNHASQKEVFLLQRKTSKHGKGLGKTTGWIHRASLKKQGVKMLGGVTYEKVDDQGIHIDIKGEKQVLDVDSVIICAGQESVTALVEPLTNQGTSFHVIGGAALASEIDARRAISEGVRIAASI